MNPAPTSIKRKLILGLFFLGVVLVAVLSAGAYLYTQLTVYAEPASVGTPSSVDAVEAGRKLLQFEDSFKSNRRGFVRLNESEINSLLSQRYFHENKDSTNATHSAASAVLYSARARIKNDDITWFAWVRRDYLGHTFNLVWQRTVQLKRVGDHWTFDLISMRVGRQTIPKSYWETVQNWMGGVDEKLTDPYQWLTHLPSIEIKPGPVSQPPELLLYNYVATPVASTQDR